MTDPNAHRGYACKRFNRRRRHRHRFLFAVGNQTLTSVSEERTRAVSSVPFAAAAAQTIPSFRPFGIQIRRTVLQLVTGEGRGRGTRAGGGLNEFPFRPRSARAVRTRSAYVYRAFDLSGNCRGDKNNKDNVPTIWKSYRIHHRSTGYFSRGTIILNFRPLPSTTPTGNSEVPRVLWNTLCTLRAEAAVLEFLFARSFREAAGQRWRRPDREFYTYIIDVEKTWTIGRGVGWGGSGNGDTGPRPGEGGCFVFHAVVNVRLCSYLITRPCPDATRSEYRGNEEMRASERERTERESPSYPSRATSP